MSRFGKDAVALRASARQIPLATLQRIVSPEIVTQVLAKTRRARRVCSRVPDCMVVFFVLALALCRDKSYREAHRWMLPSWRKHSKTNASTLCEARKRIGVAPLIQLAHAVIELLATPHTAGAFYQGMRLMALDAFSLDLPDSPANDRAFGRPGNDKSPGAFPQAQVMALAECGTHVFWRILIKPWRTAEQTMARVLVRYLEPDMLLLWDRGFTGYELLRLVQQREAKLLARWMWNRKLPRRQYLPDGSFLTKIYATEKDRTRDHNGINVRVIEYVLHDEGQKQERHRLVTTLLDPRLHPAKELIQLYHTRWEEEIAIDELKTHQLEATVLRSQTPAGVVQEIYALMLGHYVVRRTMFEAAEKAGVAPVRMSFVGALRVLQLRISQCPRKLSGRRRWYDRIIAEIAEELLPKRRRRINPRVIKRQQSHWPKKRPIHRNPPQPKDEFIDSIEVVH